MARARGCKTVKGETKFGMEKEKNIPSQNPTSSPE
jgi:hypothetical protein